MLLRNAEPNEAPVLSALAMRSKAYWGYSPEFMEACRAELSYTPSQIARDTNSFVVAEHDGEVAGFYALERLTSEEFELEALFVAPKLIGTGIGRELIEHAKSAATALGGSVLIIQGDPHAEQFYRAAGGALVGRRPSGSIPGRELPVFAIALKGPPAPSGASSDRVPRIFW